MTRILRQRSQTCLLATALVVIGVAPAIMGHPGSGIAVDRQGQVYFLDTGSGLWRIDRRGQVTHLSRTRFHWLAIDVDDCFANTQFPSGPLGEIIKVGTNPTVLLSSDYPIAIGKDGNLYYPSGGAGNLRMMKMEPSGSSSVVVALPPMANGKPLPHIGGLVAGADGSLYYTEDGAVRRISARGQVDAVVTVQAAANPPSIPALDQHPYLRGVALDARAAMYVADTGDARVLKITPNGQVTTLAQTKSPWAPTGIALFGSDIYVLEFLHTASDVRREWLPRVRKISADGTATIIMTVDRMPGAR
jgi:DNA-binding beta-propeller fold protein YncE